MKKVFVLFIMLLAALMPAKAERVVIFQGDNLYHPAVIPLPLSQDGVTLSLYGTVRPEGLFMYGNYASSLSTQDGKIVHIVFEHLGSTLFTFSSGIFDQVNGNGYWSGSDSFVSFVPSASLVVSRIIVTVDDSGSGSGETFTLCDLPTIEDGTILTSDRELVVLWQSGNYLYAKDRLTDCFGSIYGNVNQTYAQGDVIPAGWTAKKVTYGGEPELSHPEDFEPAVDHVNLVPEEISAADVNHDYWAHYVVLRDVKISPDGAVLTDKNGNEISWYNKTFNAQLPDNLNIPYDVYGIVGSYKPNSYPEPIYQLLPIRFVSDAGIETVCCMQDLLELYPKNQTIEFSCPLIVVYQNGNYLYFKDTCDRYGLLYSNKVGGPFENGDTIIGTAFWTTYQQAPQLGVNDPWQLVGHGPAVQPVKLFIEELTLDDVHSYARFDEVKIVTGEDGNSYIEDKWGNRLLIYSRFSVTIPTPEKVLPPSSYIGEVTIADIKFLIDVIVSNKKMIEWDGTYDMEGFISYYRGNYELCPSKIDCHGGKDYSLCDVNGDGEITIADVDALIDSILQD